MKLIILSLFLFAAPLQEQPAQPNFIEGMKSSIQK